MDLFEKINRSFGSWYEGLFGGGDDVRPKDILRRIIAAMEDHRKEGFDSKVYVPNQYVLEINVLDEEEKQYLLSFLDRDELEVALVEGERDWPRSRMRIDQQKVNGVRADIENPKAHRQNLPDAVTRPMAVTDRRPAGERPHRQLRRAAPRE